MRLSLLLLLILVLILGLAACSGGASISPTPPEITPIHDIQGSGAASPFAGQRVEIVGVVSGDFQDQDADKQSNLGGFFVQEEIADADPSTSEGIFVFDGNTTQTEVSAGQRVRVAGTVREYFAETQIAATTVTVTGTGNVRSIGIDFPLDTIANADGAVIADLERYEGMLVEIGRPMQIADLFNLERFGEILLVAGERPRQFTNASAPDVAGFARHLQAMAARSLILDDGLALQNPSPNRYFEASSLAANQDSLRAGDAVAAVVGNIRFSRGSGSSGTQAFRLQPVSSPQFVSGNPRPHNPPPVGGNIRVASFNVLNFFTTIDQGVDVCGPSGNAGCRGADSSAEFDRQRRKTISALLALDADVVGLMELENNGGAALQSIADGLNAVAGVQYWSTVDAGVIGDDAIAVGLLYRANRVRARGAPAILTSAFDSRFDDRRNRPTVAQTFVHTSSGASLTVAVNHLKSKGSGCNDAGDPDRGDGQGNCNITRQNAVRALTEWLATDPTSSGSANVLVIGDMNADLGEDPITEFEAAGFVNLLRNAAGPDAYSYVFMGQASALDHAFASPALAAQVTGAAEWHINADEAPLIDYNLEFGRDPGLFDETMPFRASDHDPVVVGIEL